MPPTRNLFTAILVVLCLGMTYSAADLELADRHVAEAESRIARQREIVAEHEARGWPLDQARLLLTSFEQTLHEMLEHRIAIAAELAEASGSQKGSR